MKNSKLNISVVFLGIVVFFSSNIQCSDNEEDIEDIFNDFTKVLNFNEITLCRLDDASDTLREPLEYADKLDLGKSCYYQLRIEKNKKLVESLSKLSLNDGYKNHVLARSFYYDIGLEKKFSFFKESEKLIDWASNQSNISQQKIPKNILIRKSNLDSSQEGLNAGHSEPEFIKDINKLFVRNHDDVVNRFVPSDPQQFPITVSGFELFGAFDTCDQCLQNLKEFREQHQQGQTSLSEAIRNSLQHKKIPIDNNYDFLVIYHSYWPYKQVSYRFKDSQYYYNISRYTYDYIGDTRRDIFRSHKVDSFEDSDILLPSLSVSSKKEPGIIYGHIHYFSGKEAKYNSKEKSFIFY
jgi:hypothetical protein